MGDNISYLLVMDQNLGQHNSEKSNVKVKIRSNAEKPNKCNQCDFATSRADHLWTHLKIHSGEKPNKCNQCDSAFSQAGDLKRHFKTHSGEKSNKCNQCDFACYRVGDLRTHLKTHSGDN